MEKSFNIQYFLKQRIKRPIQQNKALITSHTEIQVKIFLFVDFYLYENKRNSIKRK